MIDEHKQKVMAVFDTASEGYDSPALNYFAESARFMVEDMRLKDSENLLDVATGTGHVAIAAARELENGNVTGIDISEKMLQRARVKSSALHLKNIFFRCCDIENMGLVNNSFDVASCAFGLFFLQDIGNGLRCITKVIKPGGRLYLTSFRPTFMEPLKGMLMGRLQTYGIEPPGFSSMGLMDTPDKIRQLLPVEVYKDVDIRTRQLGHYLKSGREWFDILWNSAFRGVLCQLSSTDLKQFTHDHLRETESLRAEDGIWLDIEVLFTEATVIK